MIMTDARNASSAWMRLAAGVSCGAGDSDIFDHDGPDKVGAAANVDSGSAPYDRPVSNRDVALPDSADRFGAAAVQREAVQIDVHAID